jgi:hypothetical protein
MIPPVPGLLSSLWAQSEPRRQADAARLRLYRGRTMALLRRYYRLSFDIGRLPSLLGREVFRAKVSRHRAPSFEDSVIFVHDVERCLQRLDDVSQMLLARIALQDYTADEAAAMMQFARRHVVRLFPAALDRLSALLLEAGLLEPISCQDPQTEENSPSDGEERK